MIRKIPFSFKNFIKISQRSIKPFRQNTFFCNKIKATSLHSSSKLQFSQMSTQKASIKPQLQTSSSAIAIMQSIQTYIQSTQFKKRFNSYHYLQKYSWLCIHTWMLLYRLRQCDKINEIISSYLLKKKIVSLLEEYTREQVYEYDDIFDRQIYEELKRVQEVIFWSLDEYFVFGLKEKSLAQIIEEDFGLVWEAKESQQGKTETIANQKSQLFEGLQNSQAKQKLRWQKQEELEQISAYFIAKINQLLTTEYDKIKTGNLQDWLKSE